MKIPARILLAIAVFVLAALASIALLLPRGDASYVRILSGGKTIRMVSLKQNQSFRVDGADGHYNIVTVQDGAIAVTEATCPDHYCMHRGFCRSGSPIVCLPNRLVIEFVGETEIDAVS